MEILPFVVGSLVALVICTFLGSVLPAVLTYILVVVCSVLLICLVLIQRGRGGGLAGAFGGVGGSSAFGTRAGDVFTRITIVMASVWIALNMGLVIKSNNLAAQAQQRPGSAFLPEGAEADDSLFPDLDPEDIEAGDAVDRGTGVPSDLPPALDGGQPPITDDADIEVEAQTPAEAKAPN